MKTSWFGRTGVDHRWKPAAARFVEFLPTLYFRSPSTSQSSIRLWNLLPKKFALLPSSSVPSRYAVSSGEEKKLYTWSPISCRSRIKNNSNPLGSKKCPQKEIKLNSQVIHQWWWPLRLMFRDGLSSRFLHTSKFLKVTVTSGFNGLCKGSFALKVFLRLDVLRII